MEVTGVVIRPARESDMAYVYDTWLKALRPEYPDMRTGDYFAWMRARIDQHVIDGVVGGWVAHPEGEPDVIWGWAAWNLEAVHFVYVRPEHRRQGIGRALVGDLVPHMPISHLTDDARAIKRKHPNLLRYIPC